MGINDVIGIIIKGGNFENETPLKLFSPRANYDCALLYGKNGAGKSTISRGFSQIAGKEEKTIEVARLYDTNEKDILLSEDEKESLFVFNEDFIDENVKLNKDATGLETIVVLGKKVDIQKALDDAEEKYAKIKAEYEKQKILMDKYTQSKNKESQLYWNKCIKDKLKEKDGWAQRDQKIKNRARATSVVDAMINNFAILVPTKSELELRNEFVELFKELEEARSGKKKIEKKVEINKRIIFDRQKNIELLASRIEKPVLSEREKKLLMLQKEYGTTHTDNIKIMLSPSRVDRCPYCLQKLSVEYKEGLFKSIQNILSREADEHRDALKKAMLQECEFDVAPYNELKKQVEVVISARDALNCAITDWNNLVQQKINDVYTPIEGVISNVDSLYEAYMVSLVDLEDARLEYNKSVADTESIENKLISINADIACYEIKNAYDGLCESQDNEKKDKKKLDELKDKTDDAGIEVKRLIQQKKNVKIALDEINDGLKYIFFDSKRLTIELSQDDEYILKSRGKKVLPSSISVGERNAIALCYFFSNVLRDQKQEMFYKKQYLFVIDDPVSSFDKDNRIGIISYLRKEINRFKKGNPKTKVLILSHDLQVTHDMSQLFSDTNIKIRTGELVNNSVDDLDLQKRNEYSRLLQKVYQYACGGDDELEMYVGNSMRRILEAYSTFNYRKGMSELSCVPEVIGKLGTFAEHFENLMYRLMLNGESHSKDRVATLESNLFSDLSKEDKIRTSKEIICFLYMLDDYHVLQHLQDLDRENVKTNIETWMKDIASTIGIKEA